MEVPFGTGAGHEIPEIQALMGPPHNGNIVVLFYANGQEPVYAQIIFQGELDLRLGNPRRQPERRGAADPQRAERAAGLDPQRPVDDRAEPPDLLHALPRQNRRVSSAGCLGAAALPGRGLSSSPRPSASPTARALSRRASCPARRRRAQTACAAASVAVSQVSPAGRARPARRLRSSQARRPSRRRPRSRARG